MKQVLIARDTAYAAKTGGGTAADPSELAVGALGIFTSKGVLITAANADATLADLKEFVIAVGSDAGPVKTLPIQRRGVYNFTANEYAAPVKQVSTVTLTNAVFVNRDNTTATTATYYHANQGDQAIVRVIDKTPGIIIANIQTYAANVVAGDTPTTLAAKVVTSINADPDRIVTASSSAAVITLTAKDFGTNFAVAIDGVSNQGGTFATTTPFFIGSGTSDLIADMERLSQASTQGVMEQAGGRGSIPTYFNTVAGATYDLYFLDSVNHHLAKHAMDAQYGRFIPVMVAIPDGTTPTTGVAAIFEGLIAKLIDWTVATAPETGADSSSAS